jgi:flagellar biosynthesis/type III secretory pathway chaperone
MSERRSAFAAIVQAEIETAKTLLGCLQEEEDTLKLFSADALEQVVARKVELLGQMARHAAARDELIGSTALASDTEPMQRFVEGQDQATQDLWQQLVDLAGQLTRQNQINGSMIQLSQQRTQIALDLATRPEDKSRTYGKKGYTQPGTHSFTRVKA